MDYNIFFNMPFFGKRKSKASADSKAKLEHQLYLARENPEPVFDLSDCELQTVPPGIYSLCKVFRKEALYLQDNQLVDLSGGGRLQDLMLLQILDIHSNCLKYLPDDIKYLKNLRVLNVSNNQLKCLPNTIGSLEQLQLLDASHNHLKELPSVIGNLHRLQELNFQGNQQISSLPSSLCNARGLGTIHIDAELFKHPPKEIVCQGTDAIMRFLAKEAGVEYQCPVQATDAFRVASVNSPTCHLDDGFQAKIMQLGKMKDQKNQDLLARSQELEESQRKELELHAAMKQTKGRLLENLLVNESKLETRILRVQQDHEAERLRLIGGLLQAEKSADEVISLLLALHGGTGQEPSVIQHLLDQERLVEQELLSAVHEKYESLRRKDILKAMEAMLEEEYRCEEKLREYEEGRAVVTKTLLSQELDSDQQLSGLLVNQEQAQTALIGRLRSDEELQRAAVGALLERGDARSWGLVQQVALVEQQLAALTAVEMRRQKLRLTEHVSDLAEKRVALSGLLVDLLDQQAVRRKELLNTMREMERLRWIGDDGDDRDYWLQQYQRLLDSRPGAMAETERTLDPQLAQNLLYAGVICYLPFLAQSLGTEDSLTDERLAALGINSVDDRLAILDAVGRYREGRPHPEMTVAAVATPGKPDAVEQEETMSGIDRAECVVCMEVQCEVVFVPCGHMCCCVKCVETLKMCPMCRANIQQKIRVILP